MGPRDTSSTVLSTSEEAMIVAFRKYPLLPLDDCLYALQASIPKLTRSSPHRCLQRHGISRLPDSKDEQQGKKKFKAYPIGFFHIDIAEVRTDEGKLYLFVAIDRTSKFVLARLFTRVTMAAAKTFLEELIRTVPYKIHTVLADNGIQFADRTQYRSGPTAVYRGHPFDRVCRQYDIEHRLSKLNHPWTNGQVERMNRTLKEVTVHRYFYQTHAGLREHLDAFTNAYNFAKRLKTLRGLTPYEDIVKTWTEEPERFVTEPYQITAGLYSCTTPQGYEFLKKEGLRIPASAIKRSSQALRGRLQNEPDNHRI